ncbi:hypothetical protein Ngar_c07840 [Candidatus Nitrososphaera gargensis Ga9.2]|uniref:Uncharacterized protein n=1 Tax=Nitrososphaera gargensis (strain Ga9.2) TaxID=1237085 RepID=K0I8Z0_NITGG|nr:hypothetical protein [Candidatus Nitrososphaera gargensis]AFU57726.1 hypothetical protein Ngar_c07840 [Candidatus Nitrososphaera gargensis Ga9.2]
MNSNYFVFEGIYSGNHNLEYDTTHLDKPPAPHREIEYYFADQYHPIVFINTSNHAMGPHDNNHDLWKWEYVSWIKEAPIVGEPRHEKRSSGTSNQYFSRQKPEMIIKAEIKDVEHEKVHCIWNSPFRF